MIFLGIKYEPLSDPLVIKICEWGPWGSLYIKFGKWVDCYMYSKREEGSPGVWYSYILAIWVCVTGKGMVFKPFSLV